MARNGIGGINNGTFLKNSLKAQYQRSVEIWGNVYVPILHFKTQIQSDRPSVIIYLNFTCR